MIYRVAPFDDALCSSLVGATSLRGKRRARPLVTFPDFPCGSNNHGFRANPARLHGIAPRETVSKFVPDSQAAWLGLSVAPSV